MTTVHAVLHACESSTGQETVEVQTKYSTNGWVQTWTAHPRNGVVQAPSLIHFGTYLQQWASFSSSLLEVELATVLEPMVYTAQEPVREDELQDLKPSP